jgi:geranylgeranyl transferase type-1 subunit beta
MEKLDLGTAVAYGSLSLSLVWSPNDESLDGIYGSGFRPSPFMTSRDPKCVDRVCTTISCLPAILTRYIKPAEYGEYDKPHIIMTYTAFLSLALLRDDFSRLDRAGIVTFLHSCQRQDGR